MVGYGSQLQSVYKIMLANVTKLHGIIFEVFSSIRYLRVIKFEAVFNIIRIVL